MEAWTFEKKRVLEEKWNFFSKVHASAKKFKLLEFYEGFKKWTALQSDAI